jgi:nitrate/nitrite-specific signal transduction histidine kinase
VTGRSYISQARQEQQQYVAALLAENEQLRSAAAVAQSDARRSEEQFRAVSGELDRLRARLNEVAIENRRFAEHHQHIEEQSSNLANLYVASYQLHMSVDRATVLNTIQEIVINLIGSEQLAIYQADADGRFHLASCFGFEAEHLTATVRTPDAMATLAAGSIFAAASESQPLTACVPLQVADRVVGAILVFRLLDHKPSLEQVDHELFELLAVHASTALYCASLHEETLVRG